MSPIFDVRCVHRPNSTKLYCLVAGAQCNDLYRLKVRQNFFSVRIVNLWNKLPESVVESSSYNVFKKRLDDWIADVGF